MYKEILRSIDGIDIYPVISFIIFFAFFIGVGIYLFKMKREHIDKMANLPLEKDPDFTKPNLNPNYDEDMFR